MSAVKHVSSAGNVASASTVIPVIALGFVAIRLHIRITRREAKLALDDYVQPVAVTLFLGMCITAWIGIANHAVGYPSSGQTDPPPPEVLLNQRLITANQYMEIFASGLTKVSAVWLYRRIFVVHRHTWFDYVTAGLVAAIICWTISFFFFYLFRCHLHFSAAWTGIVQYLKYCGGVSTNRALHFQLAYPITALFLDTVILIIPIPPIWQLHLSVKHKIGITLIFLTALVGYGACITRLALATQAFRATLANKEHTDIILLNSALYWYGIVEIGLSIIAVNSPIVWQAISNLTDKLHGLGSLIGSRLGSQSSIKRKDSTQSPEEAPHTEKDATP